MNMFWSDFIVASCGFAAGFFVGILWMLPKRKEKR